MVFLVWTLCQMTSWPILLFVIPDFHRCNKALSARDQDVAVCDWYQRVYKSLCPMSWVSYRITALIVPRYVQVFLLGNGSQKKFPIVCFSMHTLNVISSESPWLCISDRLVVFLLLNVLFPFACFCFSVVYFITQNIGLFGSVVDLWLVIFRKWLGLRGSLRDPQSCTRQRAIKWVCLIFLFLPFVFRFHYVVYWLSWQNSHTTVAYFWIGGLKNPEI